MKPVLIGYGETSVGESLNCGYGELNMWATREALRDTNLEPDDIDGLIATAPFRTERFPLPRLIEHLGIAPLNFAELTGVGGASHVNSIHRATNAIENGQAETILVVAADALHSDIGPSTVIEELSDSVSKFEEPANIVPSLYAHVANCTLIRLEQHGNSSPKSQPSLTSTRRCSARNVHTDRKRNQLMRFLTLRWLQPR